MASEEQVCVIYAGVRGFLDNVQTSEISKFETKFVAFLRANNSQLLTDIRTTGKLSNEQDAQLGAILTSFIPNGGFAMK
jgi:F-type H+-transporting ATPase subunit alpha